MGGSTNCLRIVRSWTNINDPTGVSRYETEDGRTWKTVFASPSSNQTAPPEVRYFHNGHLCPR